MNDMIDYEPVDTRLARHRQVMADLTVHRRNMRERRQAKARRENAPLRAAEADRKRRQPGGEHA
jgi:hypothetical protein